MSPPTPSTSASGPSAPESTPAPTSTNLPSDDAVVPIDPTTIDTIITLSKKTQGTINRIQTRFDAIETHMRGVHSYDEMRRLRTTESNIDDLLLATERLMEEKAKKRDEEKRRTRNFAFEDGDWGGDFTQNPVPKIGTGVGNQQKIAGKKAAPTPTAVKVGVAKKLVKEKPKVKDRLDGGKGKGKNKEKAYHEAVRPVQDVQKPVIPKPATQKPVRPPRENDTNAVKTHAKDEKKAVPAVLERLPKIEKEQQQSSRKDLGPGKENEKPTEGTEGTERTRKLSEDVIKASRRVTKWPSLEDYPEWGP